MGKINTLELYFSGNKAYIILVSIPMTLDSGIILEFFLAQFQPKILM